jgi:hydroxyethylthiazole kinase-like uncharacterized protein yjeF
MIYVLTPSEMRAADEDAGKTVGRPALMRHAGERIAERIRARLPIGGRIVAFAGPGDNGGDAFAAFAALDSAYERIIYAQSAPKPSEARAIAEQRAREAGVRVSPLPEHDDEASAAVGGAAILVDAIFGTGARFPLGEPYHAAARAMDARHRAVLAVDAPTGVDCATGASSEVAVRATETVTLAALKPGLLLETAREYVGELWCAAIGIDEATLHAHAHTYVALDEDALLRKFPKRARETEKRKAGAPLVIAGSRQFPGAAVLCALGAARAGAGYVTIATPASAAQAMRPYLIEQVIVELDDDAHPEAVAETILDVAKRSSSIAVGPGLGLDERTGVIVRNVIANAELPIVADASAFFHLTKHLDALRGKRIVLTPHEGEFARLSGKGTIHEGERIPRLHEFVERTGTTTLLKGLATLVYEGARTFINTTGTNALATAGTGDVLTGIIGTLLSQGCSPFDAACMGAYWHGLAGKLAALRRPVGVIARDVIEVLADSFPATANVFSANYRVF